MLCERKARLFEYTQLPETEVGPGIRRKRRCESKLRPIEPEPYV
jgi:hypothetical protein